MVHLETVLDDCLTRLPEARSVVCVSLTDARVIGAASLSDDSDLQRLGAAAAEIFRSGALAEDPATPGVVTAEAIVAGSDQSLIFLRGRTRADIAVAYRLERSADLGLALATSRLTIAEVEAVL